MAAAFFGTKLQIRRTKKTVLKATQRSQDCGRSCGVKKKGETLLEGIKIQAVILISGVRPSSVASVAIEIPSPGGVNRVASL